MAFSMLNTSILTLDLGTLMSRLGLGWDKKCLFDYSCTRHPPTVEKGTRISTDSSIRGWICGRGHATLRTIVHAQRASLM